MEVYEDRLANGILKAGLAESPDEVHALLSRNIEIVVDPLRALQDDLWPCIWALAAVLSRQFFGKIFINCGLRESLKAPAVLASRVSFTSKSIESAVKIAVGRIPAVSRDVYATRGDARGSRLCIGSLLEGNQPAHPISCFALAGYLGYSALASVIGVPQYREEYAQSELALCFDPESTVVRFPDVTIIGLGQLGQAYLALLHFLVQDSVDRPHVVLVDKENERFERANGSTQILVDNEITWLGARKVEFLEKKMNGLGLDAKGDEQTLGWGWKRPSRHPGLALLGLDNFEARRIALAAGYDWIFEAGLGTSFLQPRVSWHSLPSGHKWSSLFPTEERIPTFQLGSESGFARGLRETPGQCGWVTFNNIRATAPSMGLVAAAFLCSEVLSFTQGLREPTQGNALLWSPIIPFYRRLLRE